MIVEFNYSPRTAAGKRDSIRNQSVVSLFRMKCNIVTDDNRGSFSAKKIGEATNESSFTYLNSTESVPNSLYGIQRTQNF